MEIKVEMAKQTLDENSNIAAIIKAIINLLAIFKL